MSLETWDDPAQLYLYRGDEVAACRPLFTGDVVANVPIPGVQENGSGIVIAHPCSMRGRGAQLNDRVLMASVQTTDPIPADRWRTGYFDRMPLPDIDGNGAFSVALIEQVGRSLTADVMAATRVACLSPVGINLLQQRTVFNMTRYELPTAKLWEAFAHTYEEADLLEEWLGAELPDASSETFEIWIRDGDPSRQERIRDPQNRASVRSEMRAELRNLGA